MEKDKFTLIPLVDSESNMHMQLNTYPRSDAIIAIPETKNEINLLTYNIFLRPPLIKTNKNDHKNSRVEEFIKTVHNFDIICLQEAFGLWNKRKQKLVKMAQKQGFVYFKECPNPPMFSTYPLDGGLITLSRYPIVDSEFGHYPYSILADSAAYKGVLYTKINVNDNFLHVFTTHTQATHGNKFDPETFITRGDQLLSFRQFLDKMMAKYYTKGDVVILCGDFNVNARQPNFSLSGIEEDYVPLKLYPSLAQDGYCNEYENMKAILSRNNEDQITDLVYESLGFFPPTFGVSRIGKDGREEPDEVILTHAVDYCTNLCLDYIFQLTPKFGRKKEFELSDSKTLKKSSILRVKPKSSRVEPFYVKHPKVTQLSDHLGLATTIEIVPFPEMEQLKSDR